VWACIAGLDKTANLSQNTSTRRNKRHAAGSKDEAIYKDGRIARGLR
jgi:hypothetical protein